MRVFVDTAWNKPNACYDPESDEFFEVQSLVDLRDYDEIYLDSLLFPGIWIELRELIIDGHHVYYFTRPWRWRELRNRFSNDLRQRLNDVRKTDLGDAYVLWKIYETSIIKDNLHKWFKPITIIDVNLKPLLMLERIYNLRLRKTRQYAALGVDVSADMKLFKERYQDLRRIIVAKAKEVWPRFMEIAAKLGLGEDDLGGLTGLAGTLTYLGWPLKKPSMHKLRRYFGLYRPSKEDRMKFMERTGKSFQRRYSGSARRYLNMLTNAVLAKDGRHLPKARDEKEVLRKLIETLKGMEPAGEV